MASYRLVRSAPAPVIRPTYRIVGERKPARKMHAAISTEFRGNAKAALSITVSDKTLGSPAYRLAPDAAERKAHGARPTHNTAEWVAYDATCSHGKVRFDIDIMSAGNPNKLSGKGKK